MGICWYCHWGWAKSVAEIYIKAVEKLNGDSSSLHYGPAHLVWADENWDRVDWCLDHFEENKGDNTNDELAIIKWSLEELAKIPIEQRKIEPENYDGRYPENFPPAPDVEVMKV